MFGNYTCEVDDEEIESVYIMRGNTEKTFIVGKNGVKEIEIEDENDGDSPCTIYGDNDKVITKFYRVQMVVNYK